MKKDFNDNDLLAFLGRLTSKWGPDMKALVKF